MATKADPPVTVTATFQRSIRLDADIDRPDALTGYVLQASARSALESVAHHVRSTQQRAFTWTGPYGGGKSSLALALAQLAGGAASTRKKVSQILRTKAGEDIDSVFCGRKPWLVLPVVGRRESVEDAIGEVIDAYARTRGRKPTKDGKRDVISELVRRADGGDFGGVLLVLDEMGKFLESANADAGDIYFFQELAEAASRCRGRLVVVGVLHQAFEQYASRLGRQVREEWAKVQGRYVDIPIVAGSDEVLELIGRAIEGGSPNLASNKISKQVAAAIQRRKPSAPANLADLLDRCWPLHPVTAAMLGPSSRRKFGQNERSVFGFLSSAEPLAFQDYLEARKMGGDQNLYLPARYWDYLRTNFEAAILNSPDGHRWAVSAEAIERVESRFTEPHVSLVKVAALIELFRDGSGIAAEVDVLAACLPEHSRNSIESALEDLARASILIYRKHLQAWGVFAGSDFDIEAAVSSARASMGVVTEAQLRAAAVLPPVTARRHYFVTGALRWFDRQVLPADVASAAKSLPGRKSRTGRFILLLPTLETSERMAQEVARQLSGEPGSETLVFGVPRGNARILDQASELAALEHVSANRPELDSDSVARREVAGRLRQLRGDLESALRDAFVDAHWYFKGKKHLVRPAEGLSALASEVCDCVFPSVPRVHNELVNRDSLSSPAAKAQRSLLHRMIAFGASPNLDYQGFPSDAGLYFSILRELDLHRPIGDKWAILSPEKSKSEAAKSLLPLWRETDLILSGSDGASISLQSIYDVWSAPPYGVKAGLLPILALTYFLANRSRLAVYVEGIFVPELTDAGVDEWLQDPSRIAWKSVRIDAASKKMLHALAGALGKATGKSIAADPLDSARALVAMTLSLPVWTQRTSTVSERAQQVRASLLKATDPVKVVFADLPEILGSKSAESLVSHVVAVFRELTEAYPSMLLEVQRQLLVAVDCDRDFDALRVRARRVQGRCGDLRMEAFASRLQTWAGSLSDVEALMSLAVSKPALSLTDTDITAATLQLAKWGYEFRQIEALAGVQGAGEGRQALAVVFAAGATVSGSFDISQDDRESARALADKFLGSLLSGHTKRDVFLAALVDAGARALERQGKESF